MANYELTVVLGPVSLKPFVPIPFISSAGRRSIAGLTRMGADSRPADEQQR